MPPPRAPGGIRKDPSWSTPEQAGEETNLSRSRYTCSAEAIESRSPRAIAPWEWNLLFSARGLFSPLMDRQLESDPTAGEIVLAAENDEFERRK